MFLFLYHSKGKKSFFYYWPGCEVTIRGVNPTYCKYYELSLVPQFEYSLQQATALVKNNSADLIGIVLLYCEAGT